MAVRVRRNLRSQYVPLPLFLNFSLSVLVRQPLANQDGSNTQPALSRIRVVFFLPCNENTGVELLACENWRPDIYKLLLKGRQALPYIFIQGCIYINIYNIYI